MNADYLTYRKATRTAILGLVIQVTFAVAMLIYAQYSGGDHASTSAAWAMGIGALVWFALVVLYDQHRRERIESMEAESLAAVESAAASAFDASNSDLRPAGQRLELITKWFLPAMSLLIGALLLGLGYLRLNGGDHSALALYGPDEFSKPGLGVFGGSTALVVGVVGFVVARFVSGMSKEPSWSALRAGAAQTVGASLLGLFLMISLFVLAANGPDWPHRLLQVVIPIAMILGGVEIFAMFLLDVYRPRAPGEVLRPSFDSRILGFVAAPDKIAESVGEAINYQFGVDVTSSWFYQMLQKWTAWLTIFALGVGWLLTSLVVVQPHQRAMVLTFGQITRPDVGPGLHVKWPWPISQVITPEHVHEVGETDTRTVKTTTGVQVIHLGTSAPDEEEGPILWTVQHAAEELLYVVQPSNASREAEDDDLTGELSMVAIEAPVHYIIEDVEKYTRVSAPGQQQELLESIGRAVFTRFVSTQTVDEVISTRRAEIAVLLRHELEEAYADLNNGEGAGIKLVFVGIAGVHPPRLAAPDFEEVVKAQQSRARTIEEARANEIRILTEAAGSVELSQQIVDQLSAIDAMRAGNADEDAIAAAELEVQRLLEGAGGEAGRQLLAASSERWKVHMNERGKAALFQGQLAGYASAPQLFRAKAYFDALESAMRGQRVFISDSIDPQQTVIDLMDVRSGADVFSTGGDELP